MTKALYNEVVHVVRWNGIKDGRKQAVLEAPGGTLVMVPNEQIKFLETKRQNLKPPFMQWDWRNNE